MTMNLKETLESPDYGAYWVGDIFYIIKGIEDADSDEDRYMDIANLTHAVEEVGICEYKGHKFFHLNTAADGFWRIYEKSGDGFEHTDTTIVDHASVSIVPLDLVALITNFNPDHDLSNEEYDQQYEEWTAELEDYGPILGCCDEVMSIQLAEENLIKFSVDAVDQEDFYLPFNGLHREWREKYPKKDD